MAIIGPVTRMVVHGSSHGAWSIQSWSGSPVFDAEALLLVLSSGMVLGKVRFSGTNMKMWFVKDVGDSDQIDTRQCLLACPGPGFYLHATRGMVRHQRT